MTFAPSHSRPTAALLPALLSLALIAMPASAAVRGETERGLERRVEALAKRVELLSAASQIRKLQRIYGYYIDKGQWGQAAALFSSDGTIEMGVDGVYRGPERIRAYLSARRGGHDGLVEGQLNIHMQLQPVVHVATDGRTAKARWRDLALEGEYQHWAHWGDGVYENDYVKEGGVWKIRRLRLYSNFEAPYKGGWAALKPAPADWRSEAAKALPSDAPPTSRYRPFPDYFVPPFHYAPGAEQ